jgi:branched-chain amino acid transport system substrate-binding protein
MRHPRSARALRIGTVVAAAAVVTACGSSGSSSPSSGGSSSGGSSSGTAAPYVWGINAELSGPVSYYGDQIAEGVAAYVNQVNAAGGINGRKISLVKLDNAASESRAAANETQLATADKAIAVFGSVLDAECDGSATIAQRWQVPTACLTVGTSNPYIYGLGADNATGGPAIVAAVRKVTGSSSATFAVMYNDLPPDITMANYAASAAGRRLVSSQKLGLTETDFTEPVAKVVAAKPDAVVVSATGPAFVTILKGLQASGLNVPVIYVDGVVNASTVLSLSAHNIYPMGPYPFVDPAKTDADTAGFVAALKTVGIKPTAANVNGTPDTAYLTASAFGAALKDCGASCTGAKLGAELNKSEDSFGPLDPKFSYTPAGHVPWTAWYLYHLAGGTMSPVASFPISG